MQALKREPLVATMVVALMASALAIQNSVTATTYPQFDRAVRLEAGVSESSNASVGDVNGDGHPDIILVKGRHDPFNTKILLNDGHGGFAQSFDLDRPYRSYSALLVDLNGDGFPDLVLSNDQPDQKVTYINDRTGHFKVGSSYGDPNWPTRNVAVADLNGDHLPDIIVANRTGDSKGSNYVCLNHGGGRFDSNCIPFSHESTTTITAADLTGDGVIDLVVPHREGGQSFVYVNDGKANFGRRIPFGPPDAAIRVSQVADLNGDGRPDIVAIDERRGTFVYLNRPDGTFSAGIQVAPRSSVSDEARKTVDGAGSPYALQLGDLNGDGKPDIIVGYVGARPTILFNDGSGQHFTPVPFGDDKGTAYGFAVADLDGDGVPDIVVARSGAESMVYFGLR